MDLHSRKLLFIRLSIFSQKIEFEELYHIKCTWSQWQVAGLSFWYVILADPSHRNHPKQLVNIVFTGRFIDDGANAQLANTHDDEKYNDSDYEAEESCTHHDPKLVPPISRQGILMGMIPSSVTLRLSLDPTTISSFRVTWGIVPESSNNILSFFWNF